MQVLQTSQEAIETKKKYVEQLKREVESLRLKLKYGGDPYTILFKEGLADKKKELAEKEHILWEITWHIHTHAILIKKYKAMTEGKLNRSGWKTVSPVIHNILYPERTTITEIKNA
ncbi:MAG: hypothetical protein ABSD92_11830 [Candidatus Bathyarchaeia archaeon]